MFKLGHPVQTYVEKLWPRNGTALASNDGEAAFVRGAMTKLAEHGSAYDLQGKIAKMKSGASTNPFIDPKGYREFVSASKAEFEKALVEQHKN